MNQSNSHKQHSLEPYLFYKLLTQQKRKRPQDPPTRYSANPRSKHREGELAPPSCASISPLHFYPWKKQASSVLSVPSTLSILTNEYLMVMAGGPSRVKEELKMSTSEDLGTGNIAQNQEQPVMPGENLLKCLLTIVNHVGSLTFLLQHPTATEYSVYLVWKVFVCFRSFSVDSCFSPAILAWFWFLIILELFAYLNLKEWVIFFYHFLF